MSRTATEITFWAAGLMILGGVGARAARGQSAEVVITHDDPDGVVLPGQRVTITMRHSRNAGVLARLEGDIVVTPGGGVADPPSSLLPPYTSGSAWYALGAPVGANLIGFEAVLLQPPFFTIGLPPFPFLGWQEDLVSYVWTAPSPAAPTEFTFDWRPDPAWPDTLVYHPIATAITPVAFPTTYIGTTLTVLPTPATLIAFVSAGVAWSGSRRRRTPS